MLCSAKEVVAASKRPTTYLYGTVGSQRGALLPQKEMTLAEAKQFLRNVRVVTLANQHFKATRPWEVVDITAKLDKDQTWIGFELETGFNEQDQYHKAFNYIWRHLRYVAFDREGSGTFPVELTFPPQNLSTFKEGKASIQKFLSYAAKNQLRFAVQGQYSGTHANISTPKYRAGRGTSPVASYMTTVLRDYLTSDEKLRLFGRASPYGYAYNQGSWIEFKLFRSFNDLNVVNAYTAVAERLAHLMDFFNGIAPRGDIEKIYRAAADYIKGDTDSLPEV